MDDNSPPHDDGNVTSTTEQQPAVDDTTMDVDTEAAATGVSEEDGNATATPAEKQSANTGDTKKRPPSKTTRKQTKFYAFRKSASLKAPAIFVDWEDCSFYLEGDGSSVEYQEFRHLSNACLYIDEYLREQKQTKTPAKKKKRPSSTVASSSNKKAKTREEPNDAADEFKMPAKKVRARTSNAQEQWDEMLKELPQFYDIHGHFDVVHEKDPQFPNLGPSIVNLKNEIKKYNTNPETSRLTSEEYNLLESIGYLHAIEISFPFERKTALWKNYFLEHGTFRVTSGSDTRALSGFCKGVADECKKIMDGSSKPVSEPGDGQDGAEASPARATTPEPKKGWKGPLTQRQYEHLESIGLIRWLELNPNQRSTTKRKARRKEAQEQWDRMLKVLPQFHAKHGHYDVQHEKDPQFADLAEPATALKKEVEYWNENPGASRLTSQEISLLDSVGYLNALKITLPFERKTARWKRFFLERGTFRITTVSGQTDSKLYKFTKGVTDEVKRILAGESATVDEVPSPAAAATATAMPRESMDGQEGGDADSTPNRKKGWQGPLTHDQYQHLEAIGLVRWLELNPNERTIMKQHDTKLHDRWQENFDKLHVFFKENGRLPKKSEDSGLYYWTHRQKRMVNQRCLTEDANQKEQVHGVIFTPKQIGQLSMVGITFQIRRKAGLEERAQEWFDYVREHDGKHPSARIPIGKWAMDQRKKWAMWKEHGTRCNLTQDFVDRLAEGGFPWVL